jgi:hypothetical protein
MHPKHPWIPLLLAASLSAAVLRAESRTLTGLVVDRAGDPVPRALVLLACPPGAPVRSVARRAPGASFPLPEGLDCQVVAQPRAGVSRRPRSTCSRLLPAPLRSRSISTSSSR